MTRGEERSPWEVLGVEPGASEPEVRRAYERLSAALAPGALALYSLAEASDQQALQEQLRSAYLTLMRAFGWEATAAAEPRPATAPSPSALAPTPVPPAVPPEPAEFTGAVLRQMRESLGLSIAEVAERTRIRPRQLESIEEEAFAALPERVFVRGFVMAVARELRLDPERVWASYGKRWEAAAGTE